MEDTTTERRVECKDCSYSIGNNFGRTKASLYSHAFAHYKAHGHTLFWVETTRTPVLFPQKVKPNRNDYDEMLKAQEDDTVWDWGDSKNPNTD